MAKSRTGFIFASHYKERGTSFYLQSDLKPNKCSWGMFSTAYSMHIFLLNDSETILNKKKNLLGKYDAHRDDSLRSCVYTLHLAFKKF